MPSSASSNLLIHIYKLMQRQRVSVEVHLKVELFSPETPENELPFRLHVELDVELQASILETITKDVLDSQRLFLSFVTSDFTPGNHDTTIQAFNSTLQAAPALRDSIEPKYLQPSDLIPSLLPFQCRSVAWLLNREGKTVNTSGDVVPLPEDEHPLPVFWVDISVADRTVYFNRLTGELFPTRPASHTAQGGVLAEEPGLGKTLESIALILLNPAPHRSPSISHWDNEAKLDIKEIKV
jgi:E3 ubiquitin-protein ligase SHPRH